MCASTLCSNISIYILYIVYMYILNIYIELLSYYGDLVDYIT